MSSENNETTRNIKTEPIVKNEPVDRPTSSTSDPNPSSAAATALSSAKKVSEDLQ